MLAILLALFQTICVGDCSGGPMIYGPSTPAPVSTCTGLHGRQEWDRLRPPIIISHRGAGNVVAPDNTWPGFVWAAGIGCIVECDLQRTKDGHLVCHHDPTIDRMTGRTDGTTVADWTLAELQAMDFSQGHIPALFSPQPITTWEEYLDLARMGFLLAPEVRSGQGAEVAESIVAAGLQDRFLVQSFYEEELLAVKAIDPSIRLLGLNVSAEKAIENGYWAVSQERTAFLARPDRDEYLAAMKAAGVRVIPYVANSIDAAEELMRLGVDGFFTDRAAHVNRPGWRVPVGTSTTIKVPPKFDLATWAWSSQVPGVYPTVVDGYATFAGYSEIGSGQRTRMDVGGTRTADSPSSQRIETSVKVLAHSETSAHSRYFGLRFAWRAEGLGPSTFGEGYQFDYQMNGQVYLRRHRPDPNTIIASGSWPAIVVGEPIPLRVETTATAITITRTDTEHSITVEDDWFPRGGMVGIYAAGLIPAIGDVTITY